MPYVAGTDARALTLRERTAQKPPFFGFTQDVTKPDIEAPGFEGFSPSEARGKLKRSTSEAREPLGERSGLKAA